MTLGLRFAPSRPGEPTKQHVDQAQDDCPPECPEKTVDPESRRKNCRSKFEHERIDDQPEQAKREDGERESYDFDESAQSSIDQSDHQGRNQRGAGAGDVESPEKARYDPNCQSTQYPVDQVAQLTVLQGQNTIWRTQNVQRRPLPSPSLHDYHLNVVHFFVMPQLTYLEAIRQGILEEMERDPTVFCIGEDIGIYGGAFKITDGFIDRFGPKRVIDTPIAESAIVGAAFGASLTGMRPVAEFQFMDFIACAMNQISNMVAKTHYLWGAPAPLVMRGPSGGGVHGGPFHSQNPEMWFVHNPGLKVVCPATPYDAKGLIKASIRDNNPVVFFEHKYLYRRIKEEVPQDDYIVPLGRARVAREGSDVSVITYAAMVHTALEAAELLEKEGISLEILDLRTLSPLDTEAILQTVRRTNKVIILHEDTKTGGLAGEITAIINEGAFDDLDGPIVRITALDSAVPFSPPQEEHFLPQLKRVIEKARWLYRY